MTRLLKITDLGSGIMVKGTNNVLYPDNATLTYPYNSIIVVTDESNIATFRSASNNNVLFSGLIGNIEIGSEIVTKENINTKFDAIANKESGGCGGSFADASYDSQTKRINFLDNGGNIVTYIDATDFIKDGMVSNVAISEGNLVITFNTDAGKEPISIALTDIFNPANYYNKTEVDAALALKADKTELPDVSTFATKEEVNAAVSAINSKDEAQDAEIALKAVKADVDAALELKADKTELEPLAKSADVTAEIAAAVEPLATKEEMTNAAAEAVAKVVAEAPEDFDTLKEVADYIASDKTKATEIENKLSEHDAAVEALNTKDAELNSAIVGEAERATAAESELTGKVVAEQARAEAKETELVEKDAELAAKDEAQDAEIAKKVDWTESEGGRKHITLKNHDSIIGTATDGSTYNLAMVSKWDVADFGSVQLHANLNSKDGSVTINDDKVVATKDEVDAVDAKVNAIDLTPFAKTEDMNAAVETLNAKDAELEAAISQAAADAVAQVVANAPEDLDTLKEVADYIAADKTKAAEIENKLAELTAKDAELVAKDDAQDAEIALKAVKADVDAALGLKADKSELPDVSTFATKEEVNAAVSAINSKDEAQDAEIALKAVKADVDAALELKADKSEIPDTSDFLTKEEYNPKELATENALTQLNETKADKTEIPDVSTFATKSEVDAIKAYYIDFGVLTTQGITDADWDRIVAAINAHRPIYAGIPGENGLLYYTAECLYQDGSNTIRMTASDNSAHYFYTFVKNGSNDYSFTYETRPYTTQAEKDAWSAKQDALVSGTNIKTINNQSILGEGNIEIQGGGGEQQQADWNQTETIAVDYIKNKPTNVSAFANDAGYLTQHQSLADYYTKSEIDAMVGNINTILASI